MGTYWEELGFGEIEKRLGAVSMDRSVIYIYEIVKN